MIDREAMLAVVRENPADDLPRLVFADWLDDHGEADRAAFVRVQVELARLPDRTAFLTAEWDRLTAGMSRLERNDPTLRDRLAPELGRRWVAECYRREGLRRHERELLTAERGLAWGPDRGLWAAGLEMPIVCLNYNPDGRPGHFGTGYRRGFVAEVMGPLAALREHLPAVLAEHPVELVRVADRRPEAFRGGAVWRWFDGSRRRDDGTTEDAPADMDPVELPRSLWESFHDNPPRWRSRLREDGDWEFATEADAVAALSAALLAEARGQVPVGVR